MIVSTFGEVDDHQRDRSPSREYKDNWRQRLPGALCGDSRLRLSVGETRRFVGMPQAPVPRDMTVSVVLSGVFSWIIELPNALRRMHMKFLALALPLVVLLTLTTNAQTSKFTADATSVRATVTNYTEAYYTADAHLM